MLRWPAGCCRRFLPGQTVPGLCPNGCCDPVAAAEFQVLLRQELPSRGRSWAGAALPRQELGRSCPPEAGAGQELPSRGRSWAGAALPRQEPRGCRSSNRRSRAAPAAVPGAATAGAVQEPRTAPARRRSGSCKTGGADAARPQGGSRLGRAGCAARFPRRLLPGSRATPASVGRLLRGSRAATGRTTLGCWTTLNCGHASYCYSRLPS